MPSSTNSGAGLGPATCPPPTRRALAFVAGAAVGTLSGLIGLGGAEFRLPLLVALFAYATRDATGLNVALSLVTVTFSLAFRLAGGRFAPLVENAAAVVTLAAGTVAGASIGVAIGIVASLLGVAGGELLIPTLALLYAVDTKVAGTLSLAISLPTLMVSLSRRRNARGGWSLWIGNSRLLVWMGAGSIAGAALGARALGWVDVRLLSLLLAALLVYSTLHLTRQARRGPS